MNAIRCRGKDRGHAFGPGCSKAHRELRDANIAALDRDIARRFVPYVECVACRQPLDAGRCTNTLCDGYVELDASDDCAARAANETRDAHPLR